MNIQAQRDKAKRLLDLHHQQSLLVLPNIWDPLGARLLQDSGYPAAATASAAVAYSQGFDDGENIPFQRMLEIIGSIASAVDIPVTADVESGYAETPDDVAENIRQVLKAGAVGINFEDSMKDSGTLRPVDSQCRRIAAIRSMADQEGIPLVINARVDVYVNHSGPANAESLAETVTRAQAYLEAGADCIYPILLGDLDSLKSLAHQINAPINVLATATLPPMSELLAAGVKRLSLGPGLLKATLACMRNIVTELKATGSYASFTRNAMPSSEIRRILGL